MPKPAGVRHSPAAQLTRGALYSYLAPRLAMDAQPGCMRMIDRAIDGVTGRNFRSRMPTMVNTLKRATQGRLAFDNGIEDLASLLGALRPQVEQADQAPGLGQIASAPGGSAGPGMVTGSPDAEPQDTIARVKAYLTEEGVAPEIINNLDAFLAAHQPTAPGPAGPPNGPPNGPPGPGDAAMDDTDDLTEGEPGSAALRVMEPRGGSESDFTPESAGDAALDDDDPDDDDDDRDRDLPFDESAEDQAVPSEQDEQLSGVAKVSSGGTSSRVVNGGANDRKPVTRRALDQAIRVAQDAAIKNQRAIRDAERYVRPWVGDLAMDANAPADIYRAALKALGVKGADKVHADALQPILDAQPRPSMRAAQDRQLRLAQDSSGAAGKAQGSFLERFPDTAKITIQ